MQKSNDTNSIISALLEARESRWNTKLSLVKYGWHLVSLQLNVPGYPKSSECSEQFMRLIENEFERYLICRAIGKYKKEKKKAKDAAGEWIAFLVPEANMGAQELKDLTEAFEESHEYGRLIDLDVLDSKGKAISSGKAKRCFICDESAAFCRNSRTHTIEEVRKNMFHKMETYNELCYDAELVSSVSKYALKAMMYEVALSPKPGLVCRASQGCHTDMDYRTFMDSMVAISPFFQDIAQLAIEHKGNDLSNVLPDIREIGLLMEAAMTKATFGVNTHKGAIFLLAISVFAAIRVIKKKKGVFKSNLFSSVVQQITRGVIQRELCSLKESSSLSHGEVCFMKYGLQGAGARGEAEQGFPTVMHHALPFMKEHFNDQFNKLTDKELANQLIPLLLKIIANNNDTNVLFRHDKTILETLKQKATMAMEAFQRGETSIYTELVAWCNENKISPGGSADLLAISLFVHFCQTDTTVL
ncbi:triphosphoribosyl-dephospho-CoA synthase [Carboxylicivirga sp. N1Y90]|uniref:triphosphoribosyl-dephospho-CoA synthase n=1 Tax=Carboxylicivirga fragile TaxID=3417571 RepID=UPI003D329FCA|nr:triphosphoribosyl-dephospho-CoA synthase [Marinilabiliaceae bacterium N1Y90]